MNTINRNLCVALLLAAPAAYCAAQEEGDNKITVTGSIQSDILIPQDDDKIGTEKTNDWALTNTYADVNVMSKYIDAGARFEFLKHPLPGYKDELMGHGDDFKGWGVPYFYIKGKYKNIELTAGNFYEQFGSGFILRTYEERSLGIDNSLLGARLVVRPFAGVTVKALTGKQRRYWAHNDALVSGADVELNLDSWFKGMAEKGTYLTLGASWVNKHEDADDDNIAADNLHKLNLPENVNAFDVRANLQTGSFGLLAEYAWKTQDPSYDNGYTYGTGNAAMLSATYSKRGMSILLQAKRSDNMAYRSRRSMQGTSSFINHLPAFTLDHTYALAALYPYATQYDGEWAYQAEFGYKFKKGTALGGKYGTGIKVNYSYVRSLDRDINRNAEEGSDGYGSAFWKWGDKTYYQDLNVQIDKQFTRAFKLNLMYMNQFYNQAVIEREGGMIHSDIFVADAKYRFNKTFTLRGELQYLSTDEDMGDWAYALLELSVLPNWMFTVSEMYNCDEKDPGKHYYQGYVTYNYKSHRLQLGYGRTRAGFNCSGGVCRYVPASKGVTLSYNYNF